MLLICKKMTSGMIGRVSTNGRAWGAHHKAATIGVGKHVGMKKGQVAAPPPDAFKSDSEKAAGMLSTR